MISVTEMASNFTEEPITLDQVLEKKKRECDEMLNSSVPLPEGELFCPGVFDGWLCWPDTLAGKSAFSNCPEFITGFDPTRIAHKDCLENGSWFFHPASNKIWSNYTTCVNLDDLSWRNQINGIYVAGYTISLAALILSLAIYGYFKTLRCSRTTLHMNLFASFATNNALWIIWYRILTDPDIISNNGIECQILHVVLHYFLITNYLWMLCEGFYLHTLLVNAFISETKLVRWLYVLGWVLPAIAIIIYTALRASDAEDSRECWINESKYTIVLMVPVCLSMALNLIFLCNILRVLLIKLRAGPHVGTLRPSNTLLQAVRATLLLVPLLGLHYLLTPFRPEKDHPWEIYYEITSAITASFQGLCVATLFCFCNGEVITQIKRRWQHIMFRPRSNSYTATTVSFVRTANGKIEEEDNV